MILVLRADFYHDPRLLQALSKQQAATLLIDSLPPVLLGRETETAIGHNCGAAIVPMQRLKSEGSASEIFARFAEETLQGTMRVLDVGTLPTYLINLRRHLRPLWFPAPRPTECRTAESLLLDAAQNGTLDLPAKIHAPIETWIIARLCRTSITPNQITLFHCGDLRWQ